MGQIQGSAAREAGALESVHFYADFVEKALAFEAETSWDRWLRHQAMTIVRECLEPLWIEKIPHYYRELLRGFAEGSGVPSSKLLRGFVMPDVYNYLLGAQHRWLRRTALESIPLGCTAFATIGEVERETPFLHARNLDFPGGMRWFEHPAVVQFEPSDGQKYVTVASLGISSAGITAMNEAGLGLSLNLNYSTRVRTSGVPILALGHEVIRTATSLAEAVEIISRCDRGGGWTYLISSREERNAVVVECNGDAALVRGVRGAQVVATNHYLESTLRQGEYWMSEGRAVETTARYQRVTDLIARREGKVRVTDALDILGDCTDPYLGGERGFGSTICQVHTVSSVVFDLTHAEVYVAHGSAPVSKGNFAKVRAFPRLEMTEADRFFRSASSQPADEARKAYTDALEAYFPHDDLVRVADHLGRAVAIAPTDGLYHSMLALVQMKRLYLAEAKAEMEKALTIAETAYRKAQNRLFLARILDLLEDRTSASTHYEELRDDPSFGREARAGLRRPWTRKRCQRLILDFTTGDAIEP